MLYKTNYHTHSAFCDGKNSLSEMAQSAFDKGIKILGFSAHTIFPFSTDWHMDIQKYSEYFLTLENLKKEYAGRMEILAGVEADYLPPVSYCDKLAYTDFRPDYIIGSVHYLTANGKINNHSGSLHGSSGGCFTVDGPVEEFFNGVEKLFGGDSKKAIQTYFALEREMMLSCDFDIVAHIDLVRKWNGELNFFNETDSWYRQELKETAKVAGQSGKVVEINTGGMTHVGFNKNYPSPDFLALLHSEGVPVTINSDAHHIDNISDHFVAAVAMAKDAGYKEVHYLSKGTWHTAPLDNIS